MSEQKKQKLSLETADVEKSVEKTTDAQHSPVHNDAEKEKDDAGQAENLGNFEENSSLSSLSPGEREEYERLCEEYNDDYISVKARGAVQKCFEIQAGPENKKDYPRGIMNHGNTCFLNSVIQVLYHTSPFKDILFSHRDASVHPTIPQYISPSFFVQAFFEKFCGIMSDMSEEPEPTSSDNITPCTAMVLTTLVRHNICPEPFPGQNDAHEFLTFVRTYLSKYIKKYSGLREVKVYRKAEKRKLENGAPDSPEKKHRRVEGPEGKTCSVPVKEGPSEVTKSEMYPDIETLCTGKMETVYTCQTCKNTSARTETVLDIQLSVNNNDMETSLQALLDLEMKEETLSGDNAYRCDKCEKLVDAKKNCYFSSLPQILTFQMKLFNMVYNPTLGGVTYLDKPNLDLSIPKTMKFKEWCTETCEEKDAEYELKGIIQHMGSTIRSGHYLCTVKKNRKWYEISDNIVTPIEEEAVLSGSKTRGVSTPYLLFFTRLNE